MDSSNGSLFADFIGKFIKIRDFDQLISAQ